MNKITLTTAITTLESGNIYQVDAPLDFSGGTINSNGDCTIEINEGGSISNAYIASASLPTSIRINASECCVSNVTYTGLFAQQGEIVMSTTQEIQDLKLPVGFTVHTLAYATLGDRGDAEFVMTAYGSVSQQRHLWPFDPVNTTSPFWIYKPADGYSAESLGIFATSESDSSIAATNRVRLERCIGRTSAILFAPGYYHINNVNVDNFGKKGTTGNNNMGLYLKGTGYSEYAIQTYIITDKSNFIYSVSSGSFRLKLEMLNVWTVAGNHFSAAEKTADRVGYGFTRFTSDPLLSDTLTSEPSSNMEFCLVTNQVNFYGFIAAFWSGQWSTICDIRNTTFAGCRYGFYSALSSNLSYFENININECCFGITAGGTSCAIKRVQIVNEYWYRDAFAQSIIDGTNAEHKHFYGIGTRSGFHSLTVEDEYNESYMGDAISMGKYALFNIAITSSVRLIRCNNAGRASQFSSYDLKAHAGVNHVSYSQSDNFIRIIQGPMPAKVYCDAPILLTGISKDGKPGYNSFNEKDDDGNPCTREFFSGPGVMHYWRGVPTISTLDADTNRKDYPLIMDVENYEFFDAITSPQRNAGIVDRLLTEGQHIFNNTGSAYLRIPTNNTTFLQFRFKLSGSIKVNIPFLVKVGKLVFDVVPVERVDGVYTFDLDVNRRITGKDITGDYSTPTANIYISIASLLDDDGSYMNTKYLPIIYAGNGRQSATVLSDIITFDEMIFRLYNDI